MNQIEFIKKWAKHGDRIEDGDFKANIYVDRFSPTSFTYVFRDDNHMAGWDSWALGSPLAPILQSPKIYRLAKLVDGFTGYIETWELIADYADEAKKEQESLIEQYLNNVGFLESSQFRNALISIDQRLKALEDKLK